MPVPRRPFRRRHGSGHLRPATTSARAHRCRSARRHGVGPRRSGGRRNAMSDRVPPPPPPRLPRSRQAVPTALGLFVVVLLSLQVFLLTVAVDAFHGDDPGLAWVTAGLSVVLAAGSMAFYRYLR